MIWRHFYGAPDGGFALRCPVCKRLVATDDGEGEPCAHMKYSYTSTRYGVDDSPESLPPKVKACLLRILRKQSKGDSKVDAANADVEDVVKAIRNAARKEKNLL